MPLYDDLRRRIRDTADSIKRIDAVSGRARPSRIPNSPDLGRVYDRFFLISGWVAWI